MRFYFQGNTAHYFGSVFTQATNLESLNEENNQFFDVGSSAIEKSYKVILIEDS